MRSFSKIKYLQNLKFEAFKISQNLPKNMTLISIHCSWWYHYSELFGFTLAKDTNETHVNIFFQKQIATELIHTKVC